MVDVVVRSLLSNRKIPSSIPALGRFKYLRVFLFLPKLTQLLIFPGSVNEYQRLLGANL